MFNRDLSRRWGCAIAGRGFFATGPAGGTPEPVERDSPTEGAADERLRSKPLPGGDEGESESEIQPRDHHGRRSDGVEELKRMEENAEAGRE